MPAKKPAPKAAKGKKAASRPAVKKVVVARKLPAERVTAAAAVRKPVPVPEPAKAPEPEHPFSTNTEETIEMRKAGPAAPEQVATIEESPSAPSEILSPTRAGVPPAVSAAEDDSDVIEPGSLLAGPRNVQPYIVKRGEQYMSKEQTEHFREILNNWKRDLMVEVDRTVSHMKDEAANFPDPNDRATQEEEFSLELRTRDRERKLIRKIDEALKRLDEGTYGYCLETGEEIGIKRLEARPVATLSIEAQERRERRERQYGDRDDRYR
jgi:RNA polymerase-binding transcription factor